MPSVFASNPNESNFKEIKISVVLMAESSSMNSSSSYQTPDISESCLKNIFERLYGCKIINYQQFAGYDDKNYWIKECSKPLDGFNINLHINKKNGQGYVLKITNQRDSTLEGYIESQTLLLKHLKNKGMTCPEPVPNKHGHFCSLEKIFYADDRKDNYEKSSGQKNDRHNCYGFHMVRLLTFVPGSTIHTVELNERLLTDVGALLAKFHINSADFSHPFYDKSVKPMWSLYNLPDLKRWIYIFQDDKKISLCNDIVDRFEKRVLDLHPCGGDGDNENFPSGILHGDLNEQNILINSVVNSSATKCPLAMVSGFLDVGDSHKGYLLLDVAISMTYMMLNGSPTIPTLDIGGYVLRGYCKHRPMTSNELSLLKVTICARLCQSLTYGYLTWLKNPVPGNQYVLNTQKNGWPLLDELWATSDEELFENWMKILAN